MPGKYILLSICAILSFIPLAVVSLIPMHDTMTVYGLFHTFYSEFISHGHLMQWSPFDMYGQPAHFAQIIALSPVGYAALIVGKIFHLTNTLVLFKIIMGVEVFIFAWGLYRLGSQIYQSKTAIWFVTLLGTATVVWITQPFFNFHFYYLWPFVILSLVQFHHNPSLHHLARSGCWVMLGLLGGLPYFIGPWALTWCVLVLCLIWKLPHRKINWTIHYGWVIFTVLLSAVLFLFVKGLTDGVSLVAPDRSANAASTVAQFLNYGTRADFKTWFLSSCGYDRLFLWGLRDQFPFIGLSCVLLSIWGLIIGRSAIARAIQAVTIILLSLVFIPVVGEILYYFPLMKYYRHLSLLLGFVKLFIILLAGFGLEHLIQRKHPFIRLATVSLLLWAGINHGLFQARLWNELLSITPKSPSLETIIQARPLPWIEQRTPLPAEERSQATLKLIEQAALNGGRYTTDYSFIQWDPCSSPWRRDWSVKGVEQLGGINPGFLQMLGGCQSPKLRVLPKSITFQPSRYWDFLSQINSQMVNAMSSPEKFQIVHQDVSSKLMGFSAHFQTTPDKMESDHLLSQIKVRSFSSNNLISDITISRAPGGWLTYADGYHPGWHARLDGKETAVMQANGAFKSTWVPEGTHTVEFYFFNGLETFLSYAIMFLGTLSLCLLFF